MHGFAHANAASVATVYQAGHTFIHQTAYSIDMELTRRDAVAALAALGVGAGAVGQVRTADSAAPRADRLAAVADVVYPSSVTATDEFVETAVAGYVASREELTRGVETALDDLDRAARDRHGSAFRDLSTDRRETVLREMGVDRAVADPEGSVPGRVRYYLVNGLLYVLFTTPTGGKLVGTVNPAGYPGGLEPYQRGPDE